MSTTSPDTLERIETILGQIALILERFLEAVSSLPANTGELPQPGQPGPNKDLNTQSMFHNGQQYVRQKVGNGRWFCYRIDATGEIVNPFIELPDGERIPLEF